MDDLTAEERAAKRAARAEASAALEALGWTTPRARPAAQGPAHSSVPQPLLEAGDLWWLARTPPLRPRTRR